MKVRKGFVSNSSSTCFVLDLRVPGVQALVNKAKRAGIQDPSRFDVGRGTSLAVGRAAVQYAERLIEYEEEDGYGQGLGSWLMKWIEEIGPDDIVFARESDEGSGGFLPDSREFVAWSRAEKEYH